jgi:hypothetical protein
MTSTEVHTTEAENHIELVLSRRPAQLSWGRTGEEHPALAAPAGAAKLPAT